MADITKQILTSQKQLEKVDWLKSEEKELAVKVEKAKKELSDIEQTKIKAEKEIEIAREKLQKDIAEVDEKRANLRVVDEKLSFKELGLKKIGRTYQKYLNEAGISIKIDI